MKIISICKFVSEYLGVALPVGRGIAYSHAFLKKHFKQYDLKTCSFDYVFKNEELIAQGKIIFVSDSFGDVLPYMAPEKAYSSINECEYVEIEDDVTEEDIEDVKNLLRYLSDMPTHELRVLFSKYKDVRSIYRIIRDELKSRGVYKTKRYKEEKELCKTKAFENPDKYERRQEIRCKKIG